MFKEKEKEFNNIVDLLLEKESLTKNDLEKII